MNHIKLCKYCNSEKLLILFHKHPNTKDGLKNKCKDCCSKSIKELKLKNVVGYKESNLDKPILRSTNPNSKICSKCIVEKDLVEFRHRKYGKNNHLYGPTSHCLKCEDEYNTKYAEKMRGKRPPKPIDQYLKNKKYMRDKYKNDPVYREKYLIRNREQKRTEKYKEKIRIQRAKWLENPTNRIAKNMRDRMRSALKGTSKLESTRNMTGIPFEDLKMYLESKFIDNMSWDNYGKNGWHIDHIIPCSLFDMTKPEHQRMCFYYKNLQPMWASDNISKSNRVNIEDCQILLNEIKNDLGLNTI